MKKNRFFTAFLCLLIGVSACTKNSQSDAADVDNTQNKVLKHILQLGFPASEIVAQPDGYMVEGDIFFPYNMEVPADNVQPEQYYTGSKVSASKVTNIRLKIDATMTSMTSEIQSAI